MTCVGTAPGVGAGLAGGCRPDRRIGLKASSANSPKLFKPPELFEQGDPRTG
ncbi:hypothetical protein ABZV31_11150 [Streptomyces sp. NPDC005202]|uniref:hypothetical protein n=1 Tax=Streptomyces sp. NPDC005202 TaxID=3157021 RepID=UPI0033A02E43